MREKRGKRESQGGKEMNMQAQMSGQVPSQTGSQLPVLSQQNVNTLPVQMQGLGAVNSMDPDIAVQRKLMRDKITQIFHHRRSSSSAEHLQSLPDIVRHLEDGLYRTAPTTEDYLNMETLESRLHSILRGYPNHNQPATRHISSSSPVSTMIPTPGMSESNSSNPSLPSSLDNSMLVTTRFGNVEPTPANMGSIVPSANGVTSTGHSGTFTTSDGLLTNTGYQQSAAHLSIGSSGNSMMSAVPRHSSQMIPTPGLNIPKSMPMNSACSSGAGFSNVEPKIMGAGLRSSVQPRPSHYGLSNGVTSSGGLGLIGNNIQLMNVPTASEGSLSSTTYGSSPRALQHQPIMTTSSSQLNVPVAGDGYGRNASDLSGSGTLYGSTTPIGSTLGNQSINPMNFQSKSKINPLHTHQQGSQQDISHKPLAFDHLQKSSLMSGLVGQAISEHETDTFPEPLLLQTSEQFHHSELHNPFQTSTSSENNKGTPGQFSLPQVFHSALSQGSQQMQQTLYPHNQSSQSQNQFNYVSNQAQLEARLQNQWLSQSVQKSHVLDESSFEKHFQEDFHQRITGQDEAQRPNFSVEGSIIRSAVAPTSLTIPQSTSVVHGLGNSLRERQYYNQQRWLLFLHHARWCPSPNGKCQEVNCMTVRQLLFHMKSCKEDQCGYPRCHQSKVLIKHYRRCQVKDCPVCVPVHAYVTSQCKTSICPDADHICSDNGSWKTNVADAERQMPSKCMPSKEDLHSQSKRRKLEPPSSLISKGEGSQLEPSDACDEVKAPVDQQADVLLSIKPEIVDVKTESSIASGLEKTEKFTSASMEDFGDVYTSRPHADSVRRDEHDGSHKTESMQIDGDTDQPAVEAKHEGGVHTADPVSGSKSGKPKIKGVSMTELFTPEQIREHIVSLRQWVGQVPLVTNLSYNTFVESFPANGYPHRSKAKAEKNQAMERSMNENSCQLCAVEKLTFEPPPIYCSLCGGRIKRNANYYAVGSGDTRHYFCVPCYNDSRGDSIEVEGTPYLKAKFERKKNDEETEEWWVQCDKCEAWQHQICALFNGRRNDGGQAEYTCPNCYIQEIERGERMPLPQSAVLGAKDLPRTILSDHIEQYLFKRLKQEKMERAKHLGKSVDEIPGAESLVIRVVSSVDKKLEVKQRFLEIFQEENYPKEFPYKSKVVLLFQKIEGVEVCLFGMYVQEFGSECQFPNQRRVYLSYLDSVKYFRPEIKTVTGEALRTFVYHEILIGYLEYCKLRGFTSCYIWACPPLKGEDYILYCHPEIQKTPKSDKLREWYLAMLRKASKESIVVDLTNLYDHFFIQSGECKAKVTAARLPYFDGDYWPGAAEDLINQLQQEEDDRKQQKKGKTKKTITKRALKAAGQSDLTGNASKDALLMQKARAAPFPCYDAEQKLEERERHPINAREMHTLTSVEIVGVPTDTKDKDEILESEFFDTRQAFLSLCQGNHYQYDTLRRAKHSSIMVLYHLHNPTAPAFVITCNICHRDIETGQGWRCEICPDFDVCNDCYKRDGGVNHPHRLTNHPSIADRNAQNKEARQKRVLQCRSQHCQYPNCRKVKGLFRHGITCRTRASGGCVLCKKMWYLLHLHARACKESDCHVPRCRDLREHLRRLQQQSDSRRRAAVMEMMRMRTAEVAGNPA
ncbi:unnamed protein product [Spirodela intermedia]|uniref:histone acetyltransferase n=1 Tax=Spirodela intermedia TaxID=51605 RepID=A0A7I8LBM8_SPIIN|nr:unnamed protein product [Spirodela intermedia]